MQLINLIIFQILTFATSTIWLLHLASLCFCNSQVLSRAAHKSYKPVTHKSCHLQPTNHNTCNSQVLSLATHNSWHLQLASLVSCNPQFMTLATRKSCLLHHTNHDTCNSQVLSLAPHKSWHLQLVGIVSVLKVELTSTFCTPCNSQVKICTSTRMGVRPSVRP